jgi:hypothetical protein
MQDALKIIIIAKPEPEAYHMEHFQIPRSSLALLIGMKIQS